MGTYMVYCTFFVYYSKKWKKYKSLPILKSNSTSFCLFSFYMYIIYRVKNVDYQIGVACQLSKR